MNEQELVARCSICKERQYDTPDGISCPSGHDGAKSVFELEPTNRCLDKNCITHDEWYAKCNELAATKQKLEAAEQVIRESQEQKPVAHVLNPDAQTVWWSDKFKHISEVPEKDTALYAKPVIIPQSAEQLYINELREALQDLLDEGVLKSSIINKALAKQPDTRALDKALLEARIETLNHCSGRMVICADSDTARAYKNGFNDKSALLNRMLSDYKAKLAELNKV